MTIHPSRHARKGFLLPDGRSTTHEVFFGKHSLSKGRFDSASLAEGWCEGSRVSKPGDMSVLQ